MYMDSSSGQRTARRGDLLKLIWTTAQIDGVLRSAGVQVRTVKIYDWKGQLPKNVTDKRICRSLGMTEKQLQTKYKTSHERDAVGIGLAISGRLHPGESGEV
jgi:hypothetical protein